jgi:hypothetical protein
LSGLLAAAFVCLKPSRACNLASLTLQDGLNIEGLLVNEDKPYACYAVPQRKESVKDNGETFVVVDRLLQDVLRLHRELVRPVVGIHPSITTLTLVIATSIINVTVTSSCCSEGSQNEQTQTGSAYTDPMQNTRGKSHRLTKMNCISRQL